jgi:8-oxo-dGTP pyrophosphatase MutT (NUDIX family)
MIEPMGGGVLPVAFRESGPAFLFAREADDDRSKDAGKWSDFGGAREKGESNYDTAVREAAEEGAGFLGTEADVAALVQNELLATVEVPGYTCYLVHFEHDGSMPARFAAEYARAQKEEPEKVAARNGLFEKDRVRWVPLGSLRAFRSAIRPWCLRAGFARKLERLPWRRIRADWQASVRRRAVATAPPGENLPLQHVESRDRGLRGF